MEREKAGNGSKKETDEDKNENLQHINDCLNDSGYLNDLLELTNKKRKAKNKIGMSTDEAILI